MRKLAVIGLAAAMALSTSLAFAQAGGAAGGSGADGMSGLGINSRMTHPPGSTTGYRVVGGEATARDYATSPRNSSAVGTGTSNLPADTSGAKARPR